MEPGRCQLTDSSLVGAAPAIESAAGPALFRVLGYRLSQLQCLEPGSIILEKVLELRPEVSVLKKALKGEYKIKVNYYGSSAVKFLGAITLQVDIFTDYGRKSEKRKSITLRLKQRKEVIDVGGIQFLPCRH